MGMDGTTAVKFINSVFKAHWKNWVFDGEEIRFWVTKLKKYDYEKAVHAINNLYASQEKPGQPPAAKVIRALNSTFNFSSIKKGEPARLYEILKEGQKKNGMGFGGNPYNDDESIEISAVNDLFRCERVYGPCTLIRLWEGEEFRQKYRNEQSEKYDNPCMNEYPPEKEKAKVPEDLYDGPEYLQENML